MPKISNKNSKEIFIVPFKVTKVGTIVDNVLLINPVFRSLKYQTVACEAVKMGFTAK